MTNQEAKVITRESIRIALIQLMKTQSIETITVTALMERAGVSRAGFYRNYSSKEAVLDEIIKDFYDKISIYFIREVNARSNLERYTALFQYIKDQSEFMDLYLAIKQKNSHLMTSNPYIEQYYANLSIEKQYCVQAFWRGIREISVRWAENGMKESPEEIATLITNLYNLDFIHLDSITG